MELEQLCILVLLCLLATSPHSTASTRNVTMEDGSGSSGMEFDVYTSIDMPSPTSSMEPLLLLPLDLNTISTDMVSTASILEFSFSSSDISSSTNILYSSIATVSFFHTKTGMPTHTTAEISESLFPTETGKTAHTTTNLPASPETETSTTEMGASTGFSDATLPLSIAFGIISSLFVVLILCIICVVIYKYSARRKSGKPRKRPLYVVEVANKRVSDLELEVADLFQSDSLILSGKRSDEPTCETFHGHLAETEAKDKEQKSVQKEEEKFITFDTFGVSHDSQNSNTFSV